MRDDEGELSSDWVGPSIWQRPARFLGPFAPAGDGSCATAESW